MALNTKQPNDLPSTNALNSIPDDLLGPIPAEVRLGANVLMVMERPPDVGDVITVTMRLKVKRKAEDEGGEEGGERVHFRGCKIVAAWLKGEPEPPEPDAEQPALFDESGMDEFAAEPEKLGDIIDINAGVDRPGFSDADQ